MGTPKGERRRDALTAAAAELLGSGGFDAVRHRAVAEKAGLPLASTTYYFASLDELVTAAYLPPGTIPSLAEGANSAPTASGGTVIVSPPPALRGRAPAILQYLGPRL